MKGFVAFCLLLTCSCVMKAERFVLTMAWTAQAEFAGYYVAQEKGFYREAGLEVEIQYPSLTSSVKTTLETGRSDAAVIPLVPAIGLIAGGTPLVNVFQTSMNSSYLIVSRWDKNPRELKGKRLAVYNSEPNYLLLVMNRKEAMNYEFVPFSSNINLFLSGAVDAMVIVSYAEYYQLLQAGFKMSENSLFRFSEHGYNIQENGVYVHKDYYQTHRRQAEAFAAASRKGWEWAAAHPEEALDIVMKHVQANKVPTNKVLQRLMLQEILRLQQDPDTGERAYRVRPDMVRKASRLMRECGLVPREVTYNELMGK